MKLSNFSSTRESEETCKLSTPIGATATGQLGAPPLPFKRPTPSELIETERTLADLWEDGQIPSLLHLAGSIDGKYEEWICRYFEENVRPTDWILASHRCHYHAQLHGMSRETLIAEVLRGRSMFLAKEKFLSSAIVAGTCSISAGLGLAIKNRSGSEFVHAFVGDGCADSGHFLESVAFVAAKGLPVRYILEDNNSSCGVTKQQRRGSDWEWNWPGCVIPVSYTPKWPHAGTSKRPQLKWKPTP